MTGRAKRYLTASKHGLGDVITETQPESGYNKAIKKNKEDLNMSAININKNNLQNEVVNSDKPVLLDFWAPWYGLCRMVVLIKAGKVNVDDQPELAGQLGVMSIPTLVVMKNGKIVNQATGARPKNAILGML